MNKSEMKSVFEAIEKKLKGQKHFSCMEYSNKAAWAVLDKIFKGGQSKYMFKGVHYDIVYTPSMPSHGNTSTTPEYEVTRYSKKTMFDADKILAKKEISVRHFHGGTITGYDKPIEFKVVDDLINLVKELYTKTSYNIMIHRYDTGDVIVWIDSQTFRQR